VALRGALAGAGASLVWKQCDPLLKRVFGSALKGCIVEQGLGGRDPGTKAEFAVMCHLRFDSVESYQQAIGPVAGQIRNDVANYASEAPIIQLSDVKVEF